MTRGNADRNVKSATLGRASTPGVGGVLVHRTLGRRPGWPEIGELRLQALDLEPEHSPAGEYEGHHPGGRVGLGKLDGQQVEHRILAGWIDLAALAAIDPLETQRRAAAPELGPGSLRREPVEAAEPHDQAVFLWTPDDVGHLDQGILQMG